MNVFLTGGTGLIGRRLTAALLARGDSVVSLSRKPAEARHGFTPTVGDPAKPGEWLTKLSESDAVVHLAGEPIAGKRWNADHLARLRSSRVDSTKLIAETLAKGGPRVLVSGSAVGIYGANTGDAVITEASPPANDTLGEMCVAWEAAADPARAAGVRVVHPRTGIVLDPDGGALPQMALPFKLFVGGRIGNGRQWLPWIHHADMTGLLLFMLDTPTLSGPVNAVSPHAVTNAEFSRVLATWLKRPNLFPVPVFMLKLLLGGVAEVVAGGQRAVPKAATDAGYQFRFDRLEPAVWELLANRRREPQGDGTPAG
jgi:uncharacterized protein (TIGR01777 family)